MVIDDYRIDLVRLHGQLQAYSDVRVRRSNAVLGFCL